MPERQRIVMISSTTLDLPQHRQRARDACERQGLFPLMMEHLAAGRSPGLARSLEMVDRCDIYVLIIGVRYGEIPPGSTISVTEAEYERALARDIPLLVYIADELHHFAWPDVETGEGATKLQRFRQRVKQHVFEKFESPADLETRLINALSFHRGATSHNFHFVADVPVPPERYVAHRYTLLPSSDLVGREQELTMLTRWIHADDGELSDVRVLVINAMGGMGKSALTWKWFAELPEEDAARFAGRMWWSFYESDATYENFTARALAYAAELPLAHAMEIPIATREQQLLEIFDRRPFLLCLDGIERLMVAYAHLDAAKTDEEALEIESEEHVRGGHGMAANREDAPRAPRNLRKMADWRAGVFLQKLTHVAASRVLVTTRHFPADLEGISGDVRPGSLEVRLQGLDDKAAIALWRQHGIRGDDDVLRDAIASVHHYPLLMRILAGDIARFRGAPGDFAAWKASNPSFDPFTLPLVKIRNDVLHHSLTALPPAARLVLIVLAAFRMPVPYDVLHPLFVGGGGAFARDSELHDALSELEDRGLIGWDRQPNRYDLHPVVRRVMWNRVHGAGHEIVYEMLHQHLADLPAVADVRGSSIDALAPAVELYYTFIALGRHNEAYVFFRNLVAEALLHRMNRFRLAIQMLEALFPQGIAHEPLLSDPQNAHTATWQLAYSYDYAGEPWRTVDVWPKLKRMGNAYYSRAENNHATVLRSLGRLKLAFQTMQRCVEKTDVRDERDLAVHRANLASMASVCGMVEEADHLIKEAIDGFARMKVLAQPSDLAPLIIAVKHDLRHGRVEQSRPLAQWAASTSAVSEIVQTHVDAFHVQGLVHMHSEAYDEAESALGQGLAIASGIGSDSEVDILIALAELNRRRGALDKAREALSEVWEPIKRGRLRLTHAEACLELAEVELAAGRLADAAEAAATAYRLAWCDGPPYAYDDALRRATAVLDACKVPKPFAVVEDMA
jgi:tetratricopeptide (TPR) repeat protein